ncbi:complex I NDUFA9 subunit family protein [Pseudorhodoplanes sp.]|uniref:complex I NDUFA9 subunit family protein n=1 Tax=Pseudorhodoplanes sp. TaxID=1934341 RepID=UPI002C2C63E2|nr:complex I NDUFA9 subunit family protein [Pseudorhodoplanes sp.]HWV54528.1 complex I NDUFA9 subunit family protein [Pseudorhodoplanes sp.]
MQTNSDTLITVFGGSGFLGRHVVRALAKRRYRIRVAVRRPELANYLQPLGTVGQIQAVQANLRYPASVEAAIRDASVAINLVGILFERGRQSFEAVQHFGAEQVALAANAHGARLLHVSAIGADEHSSSLYAQSKARGEQAVRAASPGAVIVRPSVVFGPEDDFFNRFGSLARFLPVLPLIGGGQTRLQPVYVVDVAEAIANLVESGAGAGKTYEFGGPEVSTMREIMEYVLAVTERRRLLMPLPFGLAKVQAWFTQFLPNPPLTPDQVELLRTDNVVSEEAIRTHRTLQGVGIAPASYEAIVPSYLWRFRKTGQFRTGRFA